MKKLLLSTLAMAVALTFALPLRAEEAKEANPEKAKAHQFTGEITKIEGKAVTVKNKQGDEKTFSLSDKAKVVVPGKEAGELSDLKVGDKVTAHFIEEGGQNVANKLVHADAKPKKEKKTEEKKTE